MGHSCVEKSSIDDFYIEASYAGLPGDAFDSGAGIAESIKSRVLSETGFRVSIGVATNKLLAKLASGKAKPDGIKVLAKEEEVREMLASLPCTKLPGCGNLSEKLKNFGVAMANELSLVSRDKLTATFGSMGGRIYEMCRGIDESPVIDKPSRSIQSQTSLTHRRLPHPEPTRRAIGEEIHPVPGHDLKGVTFHIRTLAEDLSERLVEDYMENARWPLKLVISVQLHKAVQDYSYRVAMEHSSSLRGGSEEAPDVENVCEAVLKGGLLAYRSIQMSDSDLPVVKLNLKVENFVASSGMERSVRDFFPASPMRGDQFVSISPNNNNVKNNIHNGKLMYNSDDCENNNKQSKEASDISRAIAFASPPNQLIQKDLPCNEEEEEAIAETPTLKRIRLENTDHGGKHVVMPLESHQNPSDPIDLVDIMSKQVSGELSGPQIWEILNQRHKSLHGFGIDALPGSPN